MPESMEVMIARIDERTKQMHGDLLTIKVHNEKQDGKIERLQAHRNLMAGAIGLFMFLVTVAFKLAG